MRDSKEHILRGAGECEEAVFKVRILFLLGLSNLMKRNNTKQNPETCCSVSIGRYIQSLLD